MLKQIMIGGIVGGLTLFFWGFISWSVISVHLVNGVFFDMPASWTNGHGVDLTVSWLLVGLVLAAIIRPKTNV